MARVDLTAKAPPAQYPTLPLAADSADFTWANGDAVNGHQVPSTGRELVLVKNEGVAAATVTIVSSPDERNRTGDIAAYSVGAGEYAVFGPFPVPGWRQADGKLYIDVSSSDIKLAVIRLP